MWVFPSNDEMISPSNWTSLFCSQFFLKNSCIAALRKYFLRKNGSKRDRPNGGVIVLSLLPLLALPLTAQYRHYDFVGAGHTYEVQVSTSSNAPNTEGKNTVDGFPIQNDEQLKDASRFLAQCTFGADMATIRMVAAMGHAAWLKEQFRLPATLTTPELLAHGPLYGDQEEFEGNGFHTVHNFNTAWSTNNLTAPDLLRQRIGFALSQLMVINNRTDFFNDVGVASSCLLYTSPSPRDATLSRMPSSA